MKKILVLAAHPDDETLGCGATIAKLSNQNHEVHLLTFTDGESSRGTKNFNRNESLRSLKNLRNFKI